jgi:hypothetical protein
MQLAHKVDKVVCTGRLYPLENIHDTHFHWSLSQPQYHSSAGTIMSMKNLTLSGIERAAFRLVAQCLRQLHPSGTWSGHYEEKVNVYLSSLMMKVPDHVYVLG